jgi:adenylosuccinate lyase
VIKRHAVAVALEMREKGLIENDLVARLGADPAIPLSAAQLHEALARPLEFVGTATEQVQAFSARVADLASRHPKAAAYRSEPIL